MDTPTIRRIAEDAVGRARRPAAEFLATVAAMVAAIVALIRLRIECRRHPRTTLAELREWRPIPSLRVRVTIRRALRAARLSGEGVDELTHGLREAALAAGEEQIETAFREVAP
jgi:hypothetical protein